MSKLVKYSQSYGPNEVCDIYTIRDSLYTVRATGVKLPRESSVYKYTPKYITTYLLGKSLENRIRFLKGYSILYIQVPLATECSKGLL